ncbi:MAG: alanine racemase [Candidatus Omnitrophota bacterium]
MIRPLWIDIDLGTLRKNIKVVKKYLSPKVRAIATIKQSAYGHGLMPIARELDKQGIDFFGVGSIEEAVLLRKDGFKGSVIILTNVLGKFAGYFAEQNITATIADLNFAKKLNKESAKQNKIVPAHIKIDTGMGRLGFYYEQARPLIKQLSKLKNISLEGIYTHFPVADSDPEFTNRQIEVFNSFISQLEKEKIFFKFRHCANSIGIANYPNAHFNMVRPGLILYGIKPAANVDLEVKPCLSLKSKIVFVKKIAKGMSVSYARSYIADKARFIGTVAVGYADGYPWALSNKGKVIIKDDLFDVAGRVCMDHIMVDLKDESSIKVGQEVILIGKSKNSKITAEDLAQWAGTIPYEIVSRLSPKIPRAYKN